MTGIIFADVNDNAAREVAQQSRTLAPRPDYRYLVVQLDIADSASVQAMVNTAIEEFGRIDYSVHCAGVHLPCSGRISCMPAADETGISR